jgi:hypothetical protein
MKTPLIPKCLCAAVFAMSAYVPASAMDEISTRHVGFDAGGGRVFSADYEANVSLGGIGPSYSSPSPISSLHGYAWQLNDPPLARADAIIRNPEDPPSRMLIAHLLANDTDVEMDSLTLSSISPASQMGGTVTSDGQWLEYTPPEGLSGIDTFTYSIEDAHGHTARGRVFILPDTGASHWQAALHLVSAPGSPPRLLAQIPVSPKIVVAASDNLANWHPVMTNVPPLEVVEYIEPAQPSSLIQFYRAVSTIVGGHSMALELPAILPDKSVRVGTQRQPRLRTVIESSPDMASWRAVLTNIGPSQSTTFVEAPWTNATLRFYRAYAQPD